MDINNIPDILKELYNETRARLNQAELLNKFNVLTWTNLILFLALRVKVVM
jgi:hypothetical protein